MESFREFRVRIGDFFRFMEILMDFLDTFVDFKRVLEVFGDS